MRSAALLVFLIACHRHDSDAERDTKGRGTTAIGAPSTTASVSPPALHLRIDARPILADVNADGHDDAVTITDVHSDYAYAAFDGMTGATLWTSALIDKKRWTDPMYVVGGLLLVPNELGALAAYDFKSPASVWTAPLGERVDDLCESTDGTVRANLVDKRSVVITLSTGELKPLAHPPTCVPLASDHDKHRTLAMSAARAGAHHVGDRLSCSSVHDLISGTTTVDPCPAAAKMDLHALDWISVDTILFGGDAGDVLIGRHKPGTGYPVIGLIRARAVVWKSDIPMTDPLAVDDRSGSAIAGTEVVVAYEARPNVFVTAFSLATGARDWHVPFDFKSGPLLSASRETIFAYEHYDNALVAYASDSGKPRFSLAH